MFVESKQYFVAVLLSFTAIIHKFNYENCSFSTGIPDKTAKPNALNTER